MFSQNKYIPYYKVKADSLYSDNKIKKQFPNDIIQECYCNYFELGSKAPNFTLMGVVNNMPEEITLSNYIGKWVLIFFYGSDFTFV